MRLNVLRPARVSDENSTLRLHRAFDSFGNIVEETHYDADGFEVIEGQTGYVDAAFAYTGRLHDKATGLQNNLNRWYDASVGRWMSEDPIGFAAGDANLYRYVGNGPVNAVDPLGLAEDPKRPDKKPNDCPPGTLPIDEHEDTKDKVHPIKKRLKDEGVGPKTWVGVTPGGDILLPNPDGTSDNVGPWQNYYPIVPQPETPWWHWVCPFLFGPGTAPVPTPAPTPVPQTAPASGPPFWVVPMPLIEPFLPPDPREPA